MAIMLTFRSGAGRGDRRPSRMPSRDSGGDYGSGSTGHGGASGSLPGYALRRGDCSRIDRGQLCSTQGRSCVANDF